MTAEYQKFTRDFRKNFNQYTRRAFQLIPKIDRPRILDIGCGSGVPTFELANLSDGKIIGIDIEQPLLNIVNELVEKRGLSSRIKIINCSLFNINFPNDYFDILWSEGSINIIGFERGLKEWKRLLKQEGYLVIHDESKDLQNKIDQISKLGYKLIEYFQLPKDAWWLEYYGHMENKLKNLYKNDETHQSLLKVIKRCEIEIKDYKRSPDNFNSAFFVLKKL